MTVSRKPHHKLDAQTVERIQALLPADAPAPQIRALASIAGLSYSTVWHVVRGYCRDQVTAAWRNW